MDPTDGFELLTGCVARIVAGCPRSLVDSEYIMADAANEFAASILLGKFKCQEDTRRAGAEFVDGMSITGKEINMPRFRLTDFERVLLQAAETSDDLSRREQRMIRFAVYFGGRRLTQRIENAVAQVAIDEGELKEDGEINWEALLDFIRQLLQIILAFIIGLPT